MALFDFSFIGDAVKRVLGPFGKLFDLISHFWTNITSLWGNISTLVSSILSEIEAWRHFRTSIAVKFRVISIPAAIDQTEEFIGIMRGAWDAVVNLWNDLKGKFETGGNPTEEAENAIKDIEESGLKGILQKFPALAKGAEKVLGFVAIVTDALASIIDAVKDLQAIVDAVKAAREEIETANTIFLKQSNPRKTLKLKDGGSIRVRIGNLHSS